MNIARYYITPPMQQDCRKFSAIPHWEGNQPAERGTFDLGFKGQMSMVEIQTQQYLMDNHKI